MGPGYKKICGGFLSRMMLGACAWETHYPCFTHSLYCNEKEELKNASVNITFVGIRRYLH